MNFIVRFGLWLEGRRKVTFPEFKKAFDELKAYQSLPTSAARDIALLQARLNQIELLVGLKREPKPEHVPGAAKIS